MNCRFAPRGERTPHLLALALLALLLLLSVTAPATAQSTAAPTVRAVHSVALTVGDLDRSVKFFTDVLTFTPIDDDEQAGDDIEHLHGVFGARLRTVRLHLGDESLELMQFLAPRGRPLPVDSRSNDGWFQHVAIIVSDMDAAYAHLRRHDVEHASPGPQLLPAWNPNAGGIAAFYFKDPDGHALEVLQFPPGKGDPKWQRKEPLFLGIDHTAIVVADTAASLAFYRDGLGMRIAGSSENWGPEQERLNNVFGARLRITALRAERGPGIELLEYLSPRTGRPLPVDTQANDLWSWQIELGVADIDGAFATVRSTSARLVSPGPVAAALVVRDPDGHALRFSRERDGGATR